MFRVINFIGSPLFKEWVVQKMIVDDHGITKLVSILSGYFKTPKDPWKVLIKEIRKDFYRGITKEYLIQKYLVENKALREIAKELGTTKTTIRNYLKKFKITRRNQSERLRKPPFGGASGELRE